MAKYDGEAFLNKIYQNLHLSDEVMHTALPSDNKNEKIEKYMNRLERVTRHAFFDGRETRDHDIGMLKKLYYDKYVIKEENIPESYFELQKKIALERGLGHLEYTGELKKEEIKHLISEQESSLDRWIDYFASRDTDMYPTWFKYYAFQGMLKLGVYDKGSGSFNRRTTSTVKPFIDIDREALAFVYDELVKSFNKEEINDEELEKLINSGNFGKLYGYAIKRMEESRKDITTNDDGIWKKYNQGSDPEVLFNDIHGKGTGWCTAGGIETAKSHLDSGDFYVYYTKGSNGEYSQPRIAIRKEYDKIAEIRGIGSNQNLESNMERVVEEKLKEPDFPDREEYKKKVEDMQMMTYIYTKWKHGGELDKRDLRFLYEIDGEIKGFGYDKDPRIEEIIKSRNIKSDLSIALEYREDQISLTKEEALKGNIKYHYGGLYLDGITNGEGLKLPEHVGGYLVLSDLTSAKGLKLPEHVSGNLHLSGLTSAEGLVLPEYVDGDLFLSCLTSAEGLELPKRVGGILDLSRLTSAEGLELPGYVGGYLDLSRLTSAKGLRLPEHVDRSLDLRGLTSAEGLKLPKHVGGSLELSSLISVEGLVLPEQIDGPLFLGSLTSAEGLKLPEYVGGYLDLGRVTSAEGLKLPKHVNGCLNLNWLASAEGLVLPEHVDGDLYLRNLTSVKDLKLPEYVGGYLNLSGLTSAEGLVLPEHVDGGLNLSRLTSAEGLVLPEHVDGFLNLRSLTSAEGLKLPEHVGGFLNLGSLTSAEGLKLPKHIGGDLDLRGLTSAEGLKLPETLEERNNIIKALHCSTEYLSEEERVHTQLLINQLEEEYRKHPIGESNDLNYNYSRRW